MDKILNSVFIGLRIIVGVSVLGYGWLQFSNPLYFASTVSSFAIFGEWFVTVFVLFVPSVLILFGFLILYFEWYKDKNEHGHRLLAWVGTGLLILLLFGEKAIES